MYKWHTDNRQSENKISDDQVKSVFIAGTDTVRWGTSVYGWKREQRHHPNPFFMHRTRECENIEHHEMKMEKNSQALSTTKKCVTQMLLLLMMASAMHSECVCVFGLRWNKRVRGSRRHPRDRMTDR